MNNSTTSEEAIEEPPPLEKLADSLASIRGINHSASVRINTYDCSVSIDLLLRDRRTGKPVHHEVFRVYDSEKPVSERHVGDNKAFIAGSMKHPRCYKQILVFLEALGYQHFHNPHLNYVEKRFREYLAEKSSEE